MRRHAAAPRPTGPDGGAFQGVMRQLRVLRDATIHIYSPVPGGFTDVRSLCQRMPVSRGIGNLTSTDNDRIVTGPGANAFGSRAQGTVELAAGGSAGVSAERQSLVLPNGERRLLVSRVVLH
ncbi:MAG: hypothetical protein ACREXU_09980 [Gammaproteobacteria bacterium]